MKGVLALSVFASLVMTGAALAQARRPPAQAPAPAQPAAPPTGRTAPYPEGPAGAFKATVQKGIATINKEKVVYTEEFMANSCLITVAQRPGPKSFTEQGAMGNARIKLTPELATAYDECLASNGFAYQPKRAEKAKGKPKPKRRA